MVDHDDTHRLTVGLRLSVPDGALHLVEQHPALQAAPAERRHDRITCHDTPDLALAALGLTLAIRQDGEHWVQTLQAPAATGLVFRRAEWLWTVGSARPEPGLLAGTPASAVPDLPGRLRPWMASDLQQTTRRLLLADGAVVHAVLCAGSILAGADAMPVHELELHLVEGPPVALFELAARLQAAASMRIELRPLSARALDARAPRVVKPADPVLGRRTTAVAGFRTVVQAGLADLLANQPAAVAAAPDGVHQMRVAVRRLRAALVLFEPMLDQQAAARFEDGLQRLGQVLGAARDWDVFCLETVPAALGAPNGQPAHPLAQAAAHERAGAYRRLGEEFARPALTSLALDLAAWVEGAAGPPTAMQADLAKAAPALFDRAERGVLKRGRHIGRRSEKQLHSLRKSLKKLRYGIEALASLHSAKPVRRYLKRCRALQELLGLLNDGAVASGLAQQLGAARPELAAEIATLRRWAAKRQQKASRKAPDAWEKFRAASAFWK